MTDRIKAAALAAAIILSSGQMSAQKSDSTAHRLTIGGYGEATMSYNFHSNSVFRYSLADRYAESKGYGQADIPHFVVMLGYNFGHGWTLGSEIEFEHGGTEVAVEVEDEETGEFEKEVERGGEVALEQFWIQKSFCKQFNIMAGHIIVPIGLTNSHHLPTEFFTVFRNEGENTILPCTWHQTGISLWGRAGDWRYEGQVLPGLNSAYFNVSEWIHSGSASPYEFAPMSKLAGVLRIDNYSVKGLRIGVSGYVGSSFNNDIVTEEKSTKYAGIKGTLAIGAADFEYKGKNFIARGNFDYGYLSDAAAIGTRNKNSNNQTESPYFHTLVGQTAMAGGVEAGYDMLSFTGRKNDSKKLYLFGRYEYYDSYTPSENQMDYTWTDRQRFAVGLNYYPMKELVVKAEYSRRMFHAGYNPEPSISIGIAYAAYFRR